MNLRRRTGSFPQAGAAPYHIVEWEALLCRTGKSTADRQLRVILGTIGQGSQSVYRRSPPKTAVRSAGWSVMFQQDTENQTVRY